MPKSIKTKLALIVVAIILPTIILLSFWNMSLNKNVSLENAIESQAQQLMAVELIIKDVNYHSAAALQGLKKEIESMPLDKIDTFEGLMKNVAPLLKIHKDTAGVLASYIGLPDDQIIESNSTLDSKGMRFTFRNNTNDPGYYASKRVWYIGAMKKNDLFQTDVYEDIVTGEPNVTYSIPVRKDGKLIGVLGVDILLTSLQGYFDELARNGNSIFVLDENAVPFVATDKSILMKESPLFKEIAATAARKTEFEAFLVKDGNVTKMAQCKSVKDNVFAPYTLCSLEPLANI